MKIDIYDEEKLLSGEQVKLIEAVAGIAANGYHECRAELTIIADAEEMRALNRETRGIDAATDVLSFPALTFDENHQPLSPDPALDYIDGVLYLGEIMILYERAVSQAAEYEHSTERELAFLTAHGTLHLMGYDHETPEDEREMFARQEEILEEMGVSRTREILRDFS